MNWIITIAWALPVVLVSTILCAIPAFMTGAKATGVAALVGITAEGLLWVGVLNVVVGLILWRVVLPLILPH